ncbi:MAG TPA: PAS domain S-box protein [Candidatus Saccharimonadales bacterium]|nr:PAS domain S-box protein [Candidatus Saccharimonadales bacterium]
MRSSSPRRRAAAACAAGALALLGAALLLWLGLRQAARAEGAARLELAAAAGLLLVAGWLGRAARAAAPGGAPALQAGAVRDDPNWLGQVLEQSREAIMVLDKQLRLVYVNEIGRVQGGFAPGELIGTDMMERVHPRDVPAVRSAVQAALSGSSAELSLTWRVKSGEWRNFDVAVNPTVIGGRSALLIFSRDVTERQRAEERFQGLVELSGDMLLQWTDAGVLVYASPAVQPVLGYSPVEMVGNTTLSFTHPGDHAQVLKLRREVATRGSVGPVEIRVRHRDGSLRWIEFNARVHPETGDIIGVGRDVTQRRGVEGALRESEERYRQLVEHFPEGILLAAGGRIRYANPAAARVLGYANPAEMSGQSLTEHFVGESYEFLAELEAVASGRATLAVAEHVILRRNGAGVLVQLQATAAGAGGEPAAQVTVRDITERRRSEEAVQVRTRHLDSLRRLSERLNASLQVQNVLQQALRDILAAMNQPFGAFYCLDRSAHEYVLEAAIEEDLPRRFLGERISAEHPYVARLKELAGPAVISFADHPVASIGRTFVDRGFHEYLALPLRIQDELVGFMHVVGELQEIDSERLRYLQLATGTVALALKNAQLFGELEERAAALRRQTETLDLIFGAVAQGLVFLDRERSGVRLNPEARRLLRLEPGEPVRPGGLTARVRARDSEGGEVAEDELPWNRALTSGRPLREVPLTLEAADGSSVHVVASAAPVRDPSGQIEGVVAALTDLTERESLEAQLRQAQKMEAVGQLAGGVAHDFNNLLTVICGYGQLFLARLQPNTPERHEMQEILSAADRAVALTRQLLTFSRRQVMRPQVLDLNAAVRSLLTMLQRLVREDVRIHTRLQEGLWPVSADEAMLEQLLLNLVLNSRDAIAGAGDVVIETANIEVDAAYRADHPQARLGRHVMLAVADTGAGIPPEALPHIFEPFFTTKEPGKGTGLGLSMVHGVVEQHRGWVRVSSDPGHWTTFRIYLPAVEAAALPRTGRLPRAAGAAGGGTETVLLVEDEPPVLALSREVLTRAGYRVLAAADGPQALERAGEAEGGLDLLLTDVVLPGGMSGWEVAGELSRRFPGLRILYTSGFSEELAGRGFVIPDGMPFLEKPYLPDDLLDAVRSVLDSPPGAAPLGRG